ncbi:MAG TPA: family 43 glycosylhydrolase [Limnochordia bacterium]|nr:family 43 glycosylhydrolase [Limnochordia bacterium]HXK97748.1 family 43 glycosylhydrolase [Limnochordia bacterium]
MHSPGWILVYTRTPVPGCYPSHLAHSVHLASSHDGRAFTALHRNYGILHALASVESQNVIRAKGLKRPWIFAAADGRMGIVAVKTNHDGSPDPEARGKVLLWLTQDLVRFEPQALVDLKRDADVEQVGCRYNHELQVYEFWWQDSTGGRYRNVLADLADLGSISPAEPVSGWPDELGGSGPIDCLSGSVLPEGAVPGNAVYVEASVLRRVERKWLPLENTAVTVPEMVYARSAQDVQAVNATAVYSDGSTARKAVRWQTDGIDFSRPGVYQVKGTVVQEKYSFPLAEGYADPVVLPWNDWYYYVATNDNVNNIGIYVRKGRTVAECFVPDAKEYLILDRDESRGLVQTFWAPEFHLCGGRLYLFFAVSGRQWGPQCHVMRLKEGGEITDPDSWEDPIRVVRRDGSNLCDRGITLDMTYFEIDGTGYVVWSERYHIGTPLDSGSMLYIATVDPKQPWRLTSDPVLLSRPLFGWENVEGTINNEGPYPLLVGDKVYLAYSGGAANGYTYAVGLLSTDKHQDLLDPANWYKSPTAVLSFYSVEGEYGPGHNAFYTNENGDVMITYHAEPTMRGSKRCTAIRRVHFDIDGEPRFDLSPDRDLRPELVPVTMKVVVGSSE